MAKRPIYYDTETTGLDSKKDRIIEIAAFDPVLNRSFVSFVNPGMPIPPASTEVCQITDGMVADAPPFKEVGIDFVEFCKGDVVLIAHNNDAFDIHFLRGEFGRNEIDLPNWPYVDTLKWARKYRPDLPSHSLQNLREHYQIPPNQAHRALDDVKILHQVFSLMIDDLPMETILELLSESKKITHMPFGKYKGKRLEEVPANYVTWLLNNGALDKTENQELRIAFENQGLLT